VSTMRFKIVTALTGLVIAGEALALMVGMHLLSEGANSWNSFKNDLFLLLDIAAALGLLVLALVHRGPAWPYVPGSLLVLSLVTHSYRDWEYLAGAANAFCANAPLLAVNNLKLALLLAGVVLGAQLVLAQAV